SATMMPSRAWLNTVAASSGQMWFFRLSRLAAAGLPLARLQRPVTMPSGSRPIPMAVVARRKGISLFAANLDILRRQLRTNAGNFTFTSVPGAALAGRPGNGVSMVWLCPGGLARDDSVGFRLIGEVDDDRRNGSLEPDRRKQL